MLLTFDLIISVLNTQIDSPSKEKEAGDGSIKQRSNFEFFITYLHYLYDKPMEIRLVQLNWNFDGPLDYAHEALIMTTRMTISQLEIYE